MKKIIFISLLIIPCFCWGQTHKVTDRIEVTDDMKRVKVLDSGRIVFTSSYYKRNRDKIIESNPVDKFPSSPIIILDGQVVNNFVFLDVIKEDDIESITLLKDSATMHIYGNTPPRIIVITTKPSIKRKYFQEHIEITDDMKRVGMEIAKIEGVIGSNMGILGRNIILGPLKECTVYRETYEVIVFDAGFESFLATQKSPAFYSESTLKAKNALMVNEWNSRHRQPSLYDSSIYEVNIDYNQNIDYGLGVEYQLYMFFRYMEKENNMSLIGNYYAAR